MANSEEKELIDALFKKDDTILARLYLKFAEDLREYFLNKFPIFKLDPFPLEDIITDALMKICKYPEKFNPEKSSLKTFLFLDVKGDIINAIEKKNRKKNSAENNLVELDTNYRNIDLETETEELEINYIKLSEKLSAYFATIFSKERDQKLAWMIKVEKNKETKKYCQLLGIEQLDSGEQEDIVKKHKDRINVGLKRSGYDDFLKKLIQNIRDNAENLSG